MGNYKDVILLLIGAGLSLFGSLDAIDSYNAWDSQKSALHTTQNKKISTERELATLEQYIKAQKQATLDKTIVDCALDFLFNVEKEGMVRSIESRVLIKGGRGGGTVNFNKIAEPVGNVNGMVRIPLSIAVTDWKSSQLLFAWMDKSLLSRQFMIEKISFAAGGSSGGSIKIEGYLYGREF